MNLSYFMTGGTGHLGRAFRRDSKLQANFLIFTRKKSEGNPSLLTINPLDQKSIETAICELKHPVPSLLIHMATCYGRNGESKEAIFEANIEYPKRLISTLVNHGLTDVLNIDTVLPGITTPYSESKVIFSEWLAREKIKKVTIALERFYGPGIPSFLSQIRNELLGEKMEIPFSHGNQQRDFIHVSDVSQGLDKVLLNWHEINDGSVVSLGSGQSYALKEVAQEIQKITRKPDKSFQYGKIPTKPGEDKTSRADLKMISSFGFTCKHKLMEDLASENY